MSGLFYNLGRKLGQVAIPTLREGKCLWNSLAGTEEEALQAELSLGAALAVELRQKAGPVNDPGTARLLAELCARLASRLKVQSRVFRCELTRAETPGAMSLPGGFLFVSDSLVNLCNGDENELAFVVAHEMAHVARGHARDRMINQTALRAASSVASRAGPLAAWLQQTGLQLLRSAHSGECEFEADALAARLVAAAGFDLSGAISLLQRVTELGKKREALGPYFDSHPPPAERIARLRSLRIPGTEG